jgi:hypothetical protein
MPWPRRSSLASLEHRRVARDSIPTLLQGFAWDAALVASSTIMAKPRCAWQDAYKRSLCRFRPSMNDQGVLRAGAPENVADVRVLEKCSVSHQHSLVIP